MNTARATTDGARRRHVDVWRSWARRVLTPVRRTRRTRLPTKLEWPRPTALACHLSRPTGVRSAIASIHADDAAGLLVVALRSDRRRWVQRAFGDTPTTLRVTMSADEVVVEGQARFDWPDGRHLRRSIDTLVFDLIEARRCHYF